MQTVPLDEVRPDDVLVVGPGEVVPTDGRLEDAAVLDESVVTGESQPVRRAAGEAAASGVVNGGSAFALRVTRPASQSTYAGIVRLAEEASEHKAPLVRLADRYAAAFVPFTLVLGGLGWALSGRLVRAVAVLVVATPCPLILAAPIAIVAGLSRAARGGVVIRDGGSLEALGRARVLLMDKTGTLTAGRPSVAEVVAAPEHDPDEILRLAAAVEQVSPHVLAAAVVAAARDRNVCPPAAGDVSEEPGVAVTGRADGQVVRVGQLAGEPPPWSAQVRGRAEAEGSTVVWVKVDDAVTGALVMRDPLRPDAPRTVQRLRAAGFDRLVLLTGDREPAAARIAATVGADDVGARCQPDQKVERVRAESARGLTVMVGDGVNDAPALAAADVGVAMGATGASGATQIADAVLTADRLDLLAGAVEVARDARRIAVQSAAAGMGLAVVAMGFAAAGRLPPVAGAILQEGIDVLVILNALRALGAGRRHPSGA